MAQTADETSATITHEVAHLDLAMSTSFGMFQALLGYLTERGCIPSNVREPYRIGLTHAISHSRQFHEAFATTRELLYARSRDSNFHELIEWTTSAWSWNAVEPIKLFFTQVDFPTALSEPLIRAIASAILNTRIFEDMRVHQQFLDVNWNDYFQSDERNPDARYEIFHSKVKEGLLSEAIFKDLLSHLRSSFGETSLKRIINRLSAETSRRKRARELASVKIVVEKALRQQLPFDMMSKKDRLASYETLFGSWSGTLKKQGLSMGKGPSLSRKSGQNAIDFYLNKIRYVPRYPVRSKLRTSLRINPSQWEEFLQLLRESKTAFYVHIHHNPSSKSDSVEEGSGPLRPHLVRLYVHASGIVRDAIVFSCPKDMRVYGPQAKACVVGVKLENLAKAISELSQIKCVFSMTQRGYSRLSRTAAFKSIRELIGDPLVICPNGSTVNDWRPVLRELLRQGKTYVYHHQLACQPNRALDLCYAVPADGKTAYIKPTLHPVFTRLLQLEPGVEKLNKWNQFNRLFSNAWVGKLRVGAMHCYTFGY